jgi:hypothetical protein
MFSKIFFANKFLKKSLIKIFLTISEGTETIVYLPSRFSLLLGTIYFF